MGFQRSAKRLKPSASICAETGGKLYSMCQIGDPVKPATTESPRFLAARAALFMVSRAPCRFFSALPAQEGGAKPSERASSFGSQTSCPARWWLMHHRPRLFCLSNAFCCSQYVGSLAALSTFMWSPQQASSSPSYQKEAAFLASSFHG